MSGGIVKRVLGWFLLIVLLGGVVLVGLGFYFGTPRPLPASEVVGHWVAEPGELGQGDFYEGGTFKLEGLSFNIVSGEDAVGEFSASGTWSVFEGSNDIYLGLTRYSDSGEQDAKGSDHGIIRPTLGWGSARQLYFSDGEELNTFKMSRQSDLPLPNGDG